MGNQFYNKLQGSPIIAAVRDHNQIDRALQSPSEIIFILKSDIPTIAGGLITNKKDIVKSLQAGAVGISTDRVSLIPRFFKNSSII